MDHLSEIKHQKLKDLINERCKENCIKQGLKCPNCGAHEVYANRENPNDTHKWVFVIKAFRIDDNSQCLNCGDWF